MWLCLITALREESPGLWCLPISMADFKLQTWGPSTGERRRALVLSRLLWGHLSSAPQGAAAATLWTCLPASLGAVECGLCPLPSLQDLTVAGFLASRPPPPLSPSCSQPFRVSWILFVSPQMALTVPYLEEPTLLFPGPSSSSFPSPRKLNL